MSFFNKIKKSDSLDKAIARKKGQSSISDKTRKKLEEKVNNTKDIDVYSSYIDEKMSNANEAILSVLRRAMLVKIYKKVIDCIEGNISPGDSIYIADEMLIVNMINNLKRNPKYLNSNVTYFQSIKDFYRHLVNVKEGSGRGVIKMSANGYFDNAHFCALEYRVIRGRKLVIFFESAKLHGETQKGTDLGMKVLHDSAASYFKNEFLTIAYLEMDIQRSSSDCAIYSLYTAFHLKFCVEWVDYLFNDMEKNPGIDKGNISFVLLYSNRGVNILDVRNKHPVTLPLQLLKHMHSVKTMKMLTNNIIEIYKKGEFQRVMAERLKHRMEKYSVERESEIYKGRVFTMSTSIEHKRKKLYEALMSEML